MDNKKIRIVLIIFIIINIVAMLTLINLINKKNREQDKKLSMENSVQNEIEMTSDGKKVEGLINSASLYQKYKGYIPKSEIADKIKVLADQYFPIIYKQVIESGTSKEEYYNKYQASIQNRFGITNYEDFNKLVGEIGKINCNISDYISYELLEDSFRTEGNYTKATLVYTYSNGQKIELDMYMLNEESETEDEYKFIPRN